ncbi:hypothetical protein A11A3_13825 [Alcanivorax hongdengensis A-11-3]|uniref:DUF1963 domain-containing protein n=1 Tax=Alcanivorax hongdengensis A-11-3 TaxID=1177179 RepID=L0W934_9GAMM|nr:DUF1963 domain-containing protein [Alcanivorax hongdengensis]EKF73436.1 hypothetical protein A11A3_13825 [Alcanivorax hongdengensis A-11-3]
MLPEELRHKLAFYQRPSWRPRSGPAVPGALSKFGGAPLLMEGESWPCCGHCHQPMQLFVQLDSRDLPAAASQPFGDGVLQVFYCTNMDEECEIVEQSNLPFSEATLCRVIPREHCHGFDALPAAIPDAFIEKSLTGWDRQVDYPGPTQLPTLADDELELLGRFGAARSGDKLLGWPLGQRPDAGPPCPCCDRPMRFVLQLDSLSTLPFMFGDDGCAHICQCPRHPQVATILWQSR